MDGQIFAGESSEKTTDGRDFFILSQGARLNDWIIIRICHTDLKEFPEYTLYNIKNDPHETINLAGKKTEILSHGLRMMDQECLSK